LDCLVEAGLRLAHLQDWGATPDLADERDRSTFLPVKPLR
jgi:hypothetical protein